MFKNNYLVAKEDLPLPGRPLSITNTRCPCCRSARVPVGRGEGCRTVRGDSGGVQALGSDAGEGLVETGEAEDDLGDSKVAET